MRAALAICAALFCSAATTPVPSTDVTVEVTGMRSTKGYIQACLTPNPAHFPDCRNDPAARRLTVPATAAELRFPTVAPGRYAIALLHDENGNGKADMTLMIPREGFGFSRNAAVRFGPPKFGSAAFTVAGAGAAEAIRMRYLL